MTRAFAWYISFVETILRGLKQRSLPMQAENIVAASTLMTFVSG